MFGTGHAHSSSATLSNDAGELLGPSVCRTLCDKQYEKRKTAAMEIEQLVRTILQQHEPREATQKVSQILKVLVTEFLDNPLSNIRKGGLIGLASCAIALERQIVHLQKDLVPPILNCFSDPEPRVRYYACEALYNVAKVARSSVLVYFNEIFDGLCKIYADVDAEVKHGSEYLDRLIKEVVTQSPSFEKNSFIPLLAQKVRVKNSHIRQLVVSWILVLLNVPGLDLLSDLPHFLEGVFLMLTDANNRDVRQTVQSCLAELLLGLKRSHFSKDSVFACKVASIAVRFSTSTDNMSRLTTLCWLNELLAAGDDSPAEISGSAAALVEGSNDQTAKADVTESEQEVVAVAVSFRTRREWLPLIPEIMTGILHNLDDPDPDIQSLAYNLNVALFLAAYDITRYEPHVVAALGEKFGRIGGLIDQKAKKRPDAVPISNVFKDLANIAYNALNRLGAKVVVRSVCLQWLSLLLHQNLEAMKNYLDQMLNPLINLLDEPEQALVGDAVRLLALVAAQDNLFREVVRRTLSWCSKDGSRLSPRSTWVVQQLCGLMDTKRLFEEIAEAIFHETNLDNAHRMVSAFNLLLLTARQTKSLRNSMLRSTDTSLLQAVISAWFHNGVSLLSLSLWMEEYDLALGVIERLSALEVSEGFLEELNQLVTFLESSSFSRVRLLSLGVRKSPQLAMVLAHIAMLLPQSEIYERFQKRLDLIRLSCDLEQAVNIKTPGTRATVSHAQPSEPDFSLSTGQCKLGAEVTRKLLSQFGTVLQRHVDAVSKREALSALATSEVLMIGGGGVAIGGSADTYNELAAGDERPTTAASSNGGATHKAADDDAVVNEATLANEATVQEMGRPPRSASPDRSSESGQRNSVNHQVIAGDS